MDRFRSQFILKCIGLSSEHRVFFAFSKLLLCGWFWCGWGWFYSWGWGWMGGACRKKWVKKTRVDAAFSRRSGYSWMREGWELGGKSWRFNSDCCIALRELHSNTYRELSSSIFQSLSMYDNCWEIEEILVQLMGFYCNYCRFVAKSVIHTVLSRNFCHNLCAFMWRKIESKSTFVEKKWQISGLHSDSVSPMLSFTDRVHNFITS